MTIDLIEAESQFRNDLESRSMRIRGGIVRDTLPGGSWPRADATNKPGNSGRGDAQYVFHTDGWPRWSIVNYTDGQGIWSYVWKPKRRLTAAEKEQVQKANDQNRKEMKEEQERIAKRQEDIAKSLRGWWARSQPADPQHDYLVRKQVEPHGIRQWRNLLMVPMMEEDGEIWNIQFIAPDGSKNYKRGARARSGLFVIDPASSETKPDRSVIYIGEGFATLATVSEVTGCTAVVAFDQGRLTIAAEYARKRWPDAKLIVCADDDWKTVIKDRPVNVGFLAAKKAAVAVKAAWAWPDFSGVERQDTDTDFNDMRRLRGADAVKAALDRAETAMVIDINDGNLPATVREVRDLLAANGGLFEFDVPVRIVQPASGAPHAYRLTPHSVVMEAHRVAQYRRFDGRSKRLVNVTLPDRVAKMYLDMRGDWELPALEGICSTPILADDGGMRTATGYDAPTRLFCTACPPLAVPAKPTKDEALAALRVLRQAFCTFAFADAIRAKDGKLGVDVVDIDVPIWRANGEGPNGMDESAFLISLMTACCRPCLWLAPGFLVNAPRLSGSGVGKGLLVRGMNLVAYGTAPRALTIGWDQQELDKRVSGELMMARSSVFLDNVNNKALYSDVLASVLTERPATVRMLGKSDNPELCCTAWIAATGNGLSVTEDLARRFIITLLDAHMENPESRPFKSGFLKTIAARRAELLAAVLTIWRWGRQSGVEAGEPLGSYEQWSEWCRDPLLALGCRDPVERIRETKEQDPERNMIRALFTEWWSHYGEQPVVLSDLADSVTRIVNPPGADGVPQHSRQWVESRIRSFVGTRVGPFTLVRNKAAAKWSTANYMLTRETATAKEQFVDVADVFDKQQQMPF